MGIYIDDGVNINAAWVNHIAVSNDGTNWSAINKAGLNVNSRWINSPATKRAPFNNKGNHGQISLTVGSDDTQIINFDPNTVLNQAGWLGNTAASMQAAVADIIGWMN